MEITNLEVKEKRQTTMKKRKWKKEDKVVQCQKCLSWTIIPAVKVEGKCEKCGAMVFNAKVFNLIQL